MHTRTCALEFPHSPLPLPLRRGLGLPGAQAMHLYHLTLQRATGIAQAVYGNFSAQKTQEVVVSHGNSLELLRPDDTGKIQSIHRFVPVSAFPHSYSPNRLL